MNNHFVNGCFKWLANELVPYYNSKDLLIELIGKVEKFYNSLDTTIDWFNLTPSEMSSLGFLNWEEEPTKGIWFIPAWLFPIIPEGIVLYDIEGNSFEFCSKTSSKESMFGCLKYGIMLTDNNSSDSIQ